MNGMIEYYNLLNCIAFHTQTQTHTHISITSMASSSNVKTSSPREKYPYPIEFNVLDFVPKLSSEENYNDWKLLMRDFIDSQGLIGFIDGTYAAEESNRDDDMESNRDDDMARKRSNNLVRQWILATLSEETRFRVLKNTRTAKDLWMVLEGIFDATKSVWQHDILGRKYTQGPNDLALQKAAINGDWDKAKVIIQLKPNAVRTPITPLFQTALTLAISSASARRNSFVRSLLEEMTPYDVQYLVDSKGWTALHHAAASPWQHGRSKNGVTSEYILLADDDEGDNVGDEKDNVGATLLFNLMRGELFVRQRLRSRIWEVAEKLVPPPVKRIREKKQRQHHALELVKYLCTEVAKLELSDVERIFKPVLRKAARVGIPEIIEEIIVSYPMALYFVDLDNLNIFKYAIFYRRESVFNLIYQVDAGSRYITEPDSSSNNGLHLAARLRREQQINLKASAAGAVLQMQRERQWFKVSFSLLHHVKAN
ncbi:hypothetical protein RHGRI_035053 [Rhododendron griersonianum]|uniref:Ankyrin repeat family protein n=1 Tax=Rhododendron griersonianum TaxID=479676 RepID=A0AAV6I3J0_9ERIC|nr:hypothetical protein RHGRI_035053 [Rhododendron griersonianum]